MLRLSMKIRKVVAKATMGAACRSRMVKNMKKYLVVIIALLALMMVVSCDNKTKEPESVIGKDHIL